MSISPSDDGLALVCPHTLVARSRASGHRHSPSLLLPSDPCQPRLASGRPRSQAASRCSRSSPPLAAPTRRPRHSSPTMLTIATRRHEARRPGLPPLSPLSSCRSCRARRKSPAAARRPRPVHWPAAEPPAARRLSLLSAATQARRPCPPGAPARHSPLQVISVGP
jgi:hypothetical protein